MADQDIHPALKGLSAEQLKAMLPADEPSNDIHPALKGIPVDQLLSMLPEKERDPSLMDKFSYGAANVLESGAKAIGNVLAPAAEYIDRYTGAPARAALENAQINHSPVEAAKAFAHQFGEPTENAPSSSKLMEHYGFSPENIIVDPKTFGTTGFERNMDVGKPEGKPGPIPLSPANIAGAIYDITSNPANLAIPAVEKAVPAILKAGGYVGSEAGKTALSMLGGVKKADMNEFLKMPELVNNARPLQELVPETVSNVRDYAKKIVDQSHAALDKIPDDLSVNVQEMKDKLNELIESPKIQGSNLTDIANQATAKLQKLAQNVSNIGVDSLDKNDIKKFIVQLDKQIDYGKNAGEFSSLDDQLMGNFRKFLDNKLKSASPEYASAMQDVSSKFKNLDNLNKYFGNEQRAESTLNSLANNPDKKLVQNKALEMMDNELGTNIKLENKARTLAKQFTADRSGGGGIRQSVALTPAGAAIGYALGGAQGATAGTTAGYALGRALEASGGKLTQSILNKALKAKDISNDLKNTFLNMGLEQGLELPKNSGLSLPGKKKIDYNPTGGGNYGQIDTTGIERGRRNGSYSFTKTLSEKPIADLPDSSPGPNPTIRNAAKEYSEKAGIDYVSPQVYAKADPERGARIAKAYDEMVHDPNDPKVKKAYSALEKETIAQFQLVKKLGIKIDRIEPGMQNPYPNDSKDVFADIKNGHLWFFPTDEGFGSSEFNASKNPLLKETNETLGGKNLKINDMFRIIHDIFGHAKEGVGFGPHGEENAWLNHLQMFSPEAQKAMTSETRGQNSWVNFGPHGESNRTNPAATIYADQKTGLLPDWVLKEGALKKSSDLYYPSFGVPIYQGMRLIPRNQEQRNQ